VSLKTERKLVV